MISHSTHWTAPIALGVVLLAAQMASAEVEDGETAVAEADGVDGEQDEVIWEFGARFRPRLEARFNHHFGLDEEELRYAFQPDEADLFSQQSRLDARIHRGGISGHLTFQHSAVWGDFGGDELTAPPLTVFEARVRYDERERIFVDAGRFELAYGDQRVLGSVGWSQVGRSWDGLRVGVQPTEDLEVDTFAARYDDGAAEFLRGDSLLVGAYATWTDPVDEAVEVADLYALYDASELRQDPTVERVTVGSRIAAAPGDADITAEGAFQFGTDCRPVDEGLCEEASVAAFFAHAEAGYAVSELRPFVGASIASGDDPDTERIEAYDQLYPTGHAWLGYTDIIGPRTNLTELRAGLQGEYEWLDYIVAAHHFRRLQPESQTVGVEFNTKVFAEITEGLSAGVGHGVFLPDDGVSATDESPRGAANWSFAQLTASF